MTIVETSIVGSLCSSASVIRMILDLQHQLCSAVVTTCECLISPSLLDHYPFDALPDTDLLIYLQYQVDTTRDRKEGKNEFSTDEALSCDTVVHQSMAKPVPDRRYSDTSSTTDSLSVLERLRECASTACRQKSVGSSVVACDDDVLLLVVLQPPSCHTATS